MTRFRHAARLIPAYGLALALTVPAAGFGAPSPEPSARADDRGEHKQGKHGKRHQARGGRGDRQERRHVDRQRGGGRREARVERQARQRVREQRQERRQVQRELRREHAQERRAIERREVRRIERQQARQLERQQRLLERQRDRERQVRREAILQERQRQQVIQRQAARQRALRQQALDEQALRRQAVRQRPLRRDRIDTFFWERHEAARRAQVRRAPGRSVWFDRGIANRPGQGIFHVNGEVTAEGLRCTAMRGDDGRLYTLEGDVFGVRPGDDVQVAARVVRNSACRQGTTLAVHRLAFLDRDVDWRDDRWDPRPVYRPAAGIRLGEYVEIEGRLTDESWDCRTMRGRDGHLFSLLGDLEGFDPGDRVEVAGRLVHGAGCPGTTIRVEDVRDDGGGILDRIFGRDDDWDDRDRWGGRAADRGELVEVHGRLASAGGCPALRADDGRTYELAGDLGGFGRGDPVRVIGVAEGGSRCGVGPSLRIAQIDHR